MLSLWLGPEVHLPLDLTHLSYCGDDGDSPVVIRDSWGLSLFSVGTIAPVLNCLGCRPLIRVMLAILLGGWLLPGVQHS